jgi:hypothetical protein
VNNWIKDVYPDLSRGVVLASEPNVAGVEKQALFEGIMAKGFGWKESLTRPSFSRELFSSNVPLLAMYIKIEPFHRLLASGVLQTVALYAKYN